MKRIKLFVSAILICASGIINAQATEKIPVNPKVKMGQLPNGLKYFILQNAKPEKKIELRLVVNAGSILEDDDQLGLAHLMEHMNFNGTKNFPKNEVVHYLQSIGVKFGADLNAYTSFDETVYILPIPAEDKAIIDKGFQVIADWSSSALLETEDINNERNVVLEESRLGKGANDRMMNKWLPEYMNGSKYAKRLPIGDDNLLKTFKPEVIRRYHKDWYRPNLQAVMVVGDIDPIEAEKLIVAKFSGFKNPENQKLRPESFDVPNRTSNKAMVLSDAEMPYTMIQIIGNSSKSKSSTTSAEYLNDVAKGLFNAMLAERFDMLKSSPNPPFIYGAGGLQGGMARGWENFQLFAICGTNNIKTATEALISEATKVKQFGFTNAELERAKANLLADYEQNFNERDKTESKVKVDELVRHFLTNEPIPGIEWEYNLIKNNVGKISLADVNQFKNEINIDKNYFALVTTKTSDKLPTDSDLKAYVDESLNAKVNANTEKELPKQLLANDVVSGKITSETKDNKAGTTIWKLSNGATVTFKNTEYKNDEILFSAYRFGGSSVYEGKDYQSADYCNNAVDEMGYGQFSNTDLQKFLAGKNAEVNIWVDGNTDNIMGKSSLKDFETAMQLFYLKSTSPRRDEIAFESFKNRDIQMIAQMKSDPQSFYSDTLNKFLYNNHPKSKQIADVRDYAQINIDNAIKFYNSRFKSANGMNFFFVGNIKQEVFKPLVEKYIGGLEATPVINTIKDLGMEPLKGENNFTIKIGNEPKSMVNEMAYFYTPYVQDDELALTLLSEIVNNRITDIIREKMEAIYGGGAGFSLSKFPKETFNMQSYLPCGPENAEKVKVAFWEIINSTKKADNIKADELAKAYETSLQRYKQASKSNNFWLASLSKYQQYGLPSENIINFESRLKAVTTSRLTEVANKYLVAKNMLHALMMPN